MLIVSVGVVAVVIIVVVVVVLPRLTHKEP
jgi:hypothetical protein